MAQTPFSLLLLRRISLSSIQTSNPRHYLRFFIICTKPFSTSSLHHQQSPSQDPSKPSSLSARMSFVFDQIDAIEKQQSQQDQTLQRIRAWRKSKQTQQKYQNPETIYTQQNPESELEPSARNNASSNSTESRSSELSESSSGELRKEKGVVELVHPWPEWIELMERFVQQNYFDHRRRDEDKMVQGLEIDVYEVVGGGDDVGNDLFKDFKTVQTACLNFGKDRFDILRSLSRQDIQILVGYGCPSVDKKVVFSAKLLRKSVHLDEGDVCSSCSLRTSCERAYLLTNKEDEARTIDVMRVLLTYGFDPLNGSVVNKFLLKQKSVKTVVRKLLHEVVKLSAVPIDPNLPPPVIKKPPSKVKQPPPPPKKRVGRDDIEMKKGDWLCPKCDFMNFAKNTVCLQCDAKRPKRQLLPGEWECPECNFLNYRRNMSCFHCDCKRPPDEIIESKTHERHHGPRTGFERVPSLQEVSNAWNFDFDDDESDGADVAAFEHADSPVMGEKSPLNGRADGGNFRGSEDDFSRARRIQGVHERKYSDLDRNRPQMGFDDFEDEDDVDSYEIDTKKNKPVQRASSNDFSEVEGFSESEDIEVSDDNLHVHARTISPSYNKRTKPMHQKETFSGSENDESGFDSDEYLSVHHNWKSSHGADSRRSSRSSGARGPSRGLSFGSDEELGLDSDIDDDFNKDFRTRPRRSSGGFQSRRNSDIEDNSFSGSESDSNDQPSWRMKSGRNREPGRRGKSSNSRGDRNFGRDAQFRSNGKMSNRRNSWNDDFDRSSRGSHNGLFQEDEYDRRRMNDKGGGLRNFKGPKRGEGFGNRQRGTSYENSKDRDFGEFRNRRREDDYGRGRMNDKGGGLRNFKGPKRGEGFGNRQRGTYYENDKDRDFGEFRNRRRVIER